MSPLGIHGVYIYVYIYGVIHIILNNRMNEIVLNIDDNIACIAIKQPFQLQVYKI